MLAHEVNSRQVQISLAVITRLFVVEVDRCLLHLCDFSLAGSDLRELVIQPLVVLVDSLLLSLEVFKQE